MTAAAVLPSDWCFDFIDITPLIPRRPKPPQAKPEEEDDEEMPRKIIDAIFEELRHEADRPVRDRINEALRQLRFRLIGGQKT